MDKYIILSPEAKGLFNDRLNFLYLKLGNFLDTEKLENRTLQYCKVFLSDAQNQIKELEESLLYQEFLKGANLTIVEQTPLNGSKVSLLIKTTDSQTPIFFHSLRLTEEEAKGKDSYEQTRLLFNKYLKTIEGTDMTMERNLIRTWIYVTNIDVNYQGVVEARNDIFDKEGLTADTRPHRQHRYRWRHSGTPCSCSHRLPHHPPYQGGGQEVSSGTRTSESCP